MITPYFLHGLESSGKGTKGTFLKKNYPVIICPDFSGPLQKRLDQFEQLCKGQNNLLLIGSSYGGLMGTCFAISQPERVHRLVLLAPALNFEGYKPPRTKVVVPTILILAKHDTICPPDRVLPLAQKTFSHLEVTVANDDHMLHNTFREIDWDPLFKT
ncbi:alpha/beta hydrolase [Desulfopila sp. IMCC35008]|uniref:alpha/beta hydrolase n=1 Tax=Desulfopila sp. IMCC35008 TaxID=2653858 RepID=UPI0013D1F1C7|nr:alpha/beta hydrolase [Desulfopila sp. IMCC35008]